MEKEEYLWTLGSLKTTTTKIESLDAFNYNIYEHIAKYFQKPRKKKETRKCYKCNKVGNLTKNCRSKNKIKNRSVQEKLDNKDNDKEEDFAGVLE